MTQEDGAPYRLVESFFRSRDGLRNDLIDVKNELDGVGEGGRRGLNERVQYSQYRDEKGAIPLAASGPVRPSTPSQRCP